jgi:apolipoprotein N-acyltransferase
VRGYDGLTPYARVGDVPALALSVALLAAPALRARRVRQSLA